MKNIGIIKDHLRILKKICEEIKNTPCRKDDYYGIFLVVFLQRLLTHMDSILRLEGNRDHLLVARSVVEGGVIFTWVIGEEDPEIRKDKAQKYFQQWLLTAKERLQAMGDKANPDHVTAIDKMLVFDTNILSAKQLNAITAGDPLNFETFIKQLTGKSLKSVIEDSYLDNGIYDRNYNYMSGFHHWSAFHMLIQIDSDGNVVYPLLTEGDYELSLMAIFSVLVAVATEMSIYFSLGKEIELAKLGANLQESVTKRLKN